MIYDYFLMAEGTSEEERAMVRGIEQGQRYERERLKKIVEAASKGVQGMFEGPDAQKMAKRFNLDYDMEEEAFKRGFRAACDDILDALEED